MTETQPNAHGELSLYRRLRHELVTPESIYGTIIVSALIVIAEDDESDFNLLVVVAGTSFVFWIAHVFAATVAHHGKRGGIEIPLGEALGNAVRHSAGLLIAAIIPILVLALGAAGIVDEDLAYVLALFVGVVILFVLGTLAFAERGSRWYFCLLGGTATALLGVVVILLKAVFH
ncbi:hypothetical protein N1027_08935 [Herbiconiux sp. CPCC 205763]|uniref:Uncharacterized protein n=1 Tax=Herbiconiux aconitum TaxID=2970913 RepID=A0ABT2GPZ6_9MICO|nr:hypothetical protein [Herbiconiux aconitum]MCS5718263.1 hypothetical protein [Herbiconiux aconitum]